MSYFKRNDEGSNDLQDSPHNDPVGMRLYQELANLEAMTEAHARIQVTNGHMHAVDSHDLLEATVWVLLQNGEQITLERLADIARKEAIGFTPDMAANLFLSDPDYEFNAGCIELAEEGAQ